MSAVEVLGVGAPIIDIIVEVSEEFVVSLPGRKGGMIPIDEKTLHFILNNCEKDAVQFLGGSGANTIRGLAKFGHPCAFLGRIGHDAAGRKFIEGMAAEGVRTNFLLPTATPTAQVLCLITPDKERTMRSFLGASVELSVNDLKPEMFTGIKLLHMEGYNLLNSSVAERAMELARSAGAKISFDLGSFEMVENHKERIIHYLTRYIDILFANKDEIFSLTKLDPIKGGDILRDLCEIVVVLMGKEGCYAAYGKHQLHHPATPVVEVPVDTTGAGDLFASGFLHGYLQDCPLIKCAEYGVRMGAAAVQVKGVQILGLEDI